MMSSKQDEIFTSGPHTTTLVGSGKRRVFKWVNDAPQEVSLHKGPIIQYDGSDVTKGELLAISAVNKAAAKAEKDFKTTREKRELKPKKNEAVESPASPVIFSSTVTSPELDPSKFCEELKGDGEVSFVAHSDTVEVSFSCRP